MFRILVADPLDAIGIAMLGQSGAEVHELQEDERPRLPELIADFDALVVRSATKVTADLLRAGKRLKVVGRAGIGVDNVDVATATELGILVVNAPTANVLSATEHTFALMLALARKLPAADASIKAGVWDRKSFVGCELQGKTLGIVGFGRIGQRVAARARAFEMKVLAFDPFLDASVARREEVEPVSLEEVLRRADVVTLHTPLTAETRNLINAERLALMKPGALLINCGRGGVVDEDALLRALDSGHLAGAALDVYEQEPLQDFVLARHPKVVATPHIGAQTREAQERIATETARMVAMALEGSLAITAVNLPFRPAGPKGTPFLHLGEQLGKLAASLLGGSLSRLQVDFWGVEDGLQTPVTVAVLKGALTPSMGTGVNYVNAERVAESRGIAVVHSAHRQPSVYAQLVAVKVEGANGTLDLAGTIFGEGDIRVVRFRGFPLEFRPEGTLMVMRNLDVPGVIGELGRHLGAAEINIADIHLAREPGKREAVAALHLDRQPAAAVVEALRAMSQVLEVRVVDLGRMA